MVKTTVISQKRAAAQRVLLQILATLKAVVEMVAVLAAKSVALAIVTPPLYLAITYFWFGHGIHNQLTMTPFADLRLHDLTVEPQYAKALYVWAFWLNMSALLLWQALVAFTRFEISVGSWRHDVYVHDPHGEQDARYSGSTTD